MKKLLIILLLYLSMPFSNAATIIAIKNTGDWSNHTTWSGGVVPTYGDSVVIPINKQVTFDLSVNQSYPILYNAPLRINVLGTFYFPNGSKLALPCGSVVYVAVSGYIIAQNQTGGGNVNSSIIDICDHRVWNAGIGNVNDTIFKYDAPLPVELVSFEAKCNGKATITWTTMTETNNDYFTLERSTDAGNWDFVANIRGNGNSNGILNYQFTDEKSFPGISYYRLRQTDFDGRNETFSPVSVICNPSLVSDINMYPNPFKGELIITYSDLTEAKATVKVYDMIGNIIVNREVEVSEGTNNFVFNLLDIANGLYNVEFISGNTRYHQKMLKN